MLAKQVLYHLNNNTSSPFCSSYFLEMGSHELFAWAYLELWSSQSQPPKELGLQAWATGAWLRDLLKTQIPLKILIHWFRREAQESIVSFSLFWFFFFFGSTGVELRTLRLLGRYSTHWATSQARRIKLLRSPQEILTQGATNIDYSVINIYVFICRYNNIYILRHGLIM
jgi:hypothetical protein